MPECRSYFSFFYYDSLFDLPSYKSQDHACRQIYHGAAHCSSSFFEEWFECFVSSKIFHHVRSDMFCSKKYHHTDILFSRFVQAAIYRPAKIHPTQRYTLADLQIMFFLSDYQIQVISSALQYPDKVFHFAFRFARHFSFTVSS